MNRAKLLNEALVGQVSLQKVSKVFKSRHKSFTAAQEDYTKTGTRVTGPCTPKDTPFAAEGS